MDDFELNQFASNQASLDLRQTFISNVVRHLKIQFSGPSFFQVVSGYRVTVVNRHPKRDMVCIEGAQRACRLGKSGMVSPQLGFCL